MSGVSNTNNIHRALRHYMTRKIPDIKDDQLYFELIKFFKTGEWSDTAKKKLCDKIEHYFPVIEFSPQKHTMLALPDGPPCKMKITDMVSYSSSGQVWNCTIDGHPIVLKMPANEQDVCHYEIFMEMIISILLDASKDYILPKISQEDWFVWPFPNINFGGKCSIEGEHAGFVIGMEKYQVTLGKAIDRDDVSFFDMIDIFIQISIYLIHLQKHIGFCHRDLYSNNVMLTRLRYPIVKNYTISGSIISTISKYNAYIIDMGQSCVDFNLCEEFNIPYIMGGFQISYKNNIDTDGWFNYSNDLRLLVGSTISYIRDYSSIKYTLEQLRIFTDFYKAAYADIKGHNINNKLDYSKSHKEWSKLYKVPPDIINQHFMPVNFLQHLQDITKHTDIVHDSHPMMTFKNYDKNRRELSQG